MGDEVISVAAGFPTTINPIIQFGAVPVFLDIEIPTYNISVDRLESAITPKTKAIMLAHTLGNPFNVDVVKAVCRKHNLWLIEDCCDALGSKYGNQNVGTFGDIGTLSFYPAHHITMGEGGAVFTNSRNSKKSLKAFVIGDVIVIVRLVAITLVGGVSGGNLVICPWVTITNISTLTWVST